jgi:hypothetical protein
MHAACSIVSKPPVPWHSESIPPMPEPTMYAKVLIRCVRPAALALAAVVIALAPARADDPFYKGKSISLIIASNTSGGYDT